MRSPVSEPKNPHPRRVSESNVRKCASVLLFDALANHMHGVGVARERVQRGGSGTGVPCRYVCQLRELPRAFVIPAPARP